MAVAGDPAAGSVNNNAPTIADLRANPTLSMQAYNALAALGLVKDPSDSSSAESEDPSAKHIMETGKQKTKSNRNKRRHKRRQRDRSNDSHSESDGGSNVKWPNENPRYNNFGKSDTKYRNLDFRTLVAGEMNICCMNGITQSERGARLRLLGDIVFNAGYYQWQAILKFHAAILSEIKNGNMQWGDCYSKLEQQMLMPFPIGKKNDKKRGNSPGNQRRGRDNEHNGGHTEEKVVYCGEYQNRNCQHTNNHSGQFFGQTTQMLHICAACWRRNKVKAQHPSASPDCPHYEH